MYKKKYNINFIILILLIIIYVITRVYMSMYHFTHYDDLYPAYTIREIFSYNTQKMQEQLQKYGINIIIIKLIYQIFGENLTQIFLKYLSAPIAIAKTSTYAPLQFYVTGLFAWINVDYKWSIFFVRLPSLLFSMIYIYICIKLIKIITVKDEIIAYIAFIIFPLTSWMFLVYSSQGQNYVIGLIFIPIMILILHRNKNTTAKLNQQIKYNLILIAGIFSSYQIIWFIPAFLITNLVIISNNKNYQIKDKINYSILNITFTIGGIYLAYILFIRNLINQRINDGKGLGIGWNAGKYSQYQFNNENITGLDNILSFPIFIFKNINEVYWSVIGMGEFESITINILLYGFYGLVLLGIIGCHNNKKIRFINNFFIVTILSWLFTVLIGIIAFSPTRHSLIYLSIFWFYAGMGLFNITKINRKFINGKIIFLSYILLNFCLFIYSFEKEMKERENKIIKTDLITRLYNVNPQNIYTLSYTLDLNFDRKIKSNYEKKWINEYPFYEKYTSNQINNSGIYIVCSVYDSCDDKEKIKLIFSQNGEEINNYKLKYNEKILSATSVCFGNYTTNGTNQLYVSAYEKIN